MIRGVDYIGVGIGAVIVNDKKQVLLAKRGKKAKNERGKWEFPGGSVEFGDTMEATINREIKEELGVEIDLYEHLPAIDHIISEENQHWVTSGFIARIKKGIPTVMEPEKCEGIEWFDYEQLKAMKKELSLASVQYLPYIEEYL